MFSRGILFCLISVSCLSFAVQASVIPCDKAGIGQNKSKNPLPVSSSEYGTSLFVSKSKELKLLGQKDSEENGLYKMGIRDHVRGLDHVKYELAFHKAMLRAEEEGTFERKSTHVPEYAYLVRRRLEYIESGFHQQFEYALKKWEQNLNNAKRNAAVISNNYFGGRKFEEISGKDKRGAWGKKESYIRWKHIREDIQWYETRIKNKNKDEAKRPEIYESLKKEAIERVVNRQVTYDWFMKWNFRLAVWASPASRVFHVNNGKYWKNHYDSLDLLEAEVKKDGVKNQKLLKDLFSLYGVVEMRGATIVTMMFSSDMDLGYFAINQLAADRIGVQMLINKPIMIDGQMSDSVDAIVHDIIHFHNGAGFGNIELHNQIQNKKKSLSKEDREKLELIYFYYHHEDAGSTSIEMMEGNIKRRILNPDDLGSLLPKSVDVSSESQVENYLSSAINVFETVTQGFRLF